MKKSKGQTKDGSSKKEDLSSLPIPDSESQLVIDLPDGQKLVVGALPAGTVIEVATWRGTGRPDSRTNRLMLGVSNSTNQEPRENDKPKADMNEGPSKVEDKNSQNWSEKRFLSQTITFLKWLFNVKKGEVSQVGATSKSKKPRFLSSLRGKFRNAGQARKSSSRSEVVSKPALSPENLNWLDDLFEENNKLSRVEPVNLATKKGVTAKHPKVHSARSTSKSKKPLPKKRQGSGRR